MAKSTEKPTVTQSQFEARNTFSLKEAAGLLGRAVVSLWLMVNDRRIDATYAGDYSQGTERGEVVRGRGRPKVVNGTNRTGITLDKEAVLKAKQLSRGIETLVFAPERNRTEIAKRARMAAAAAKAAEREAIASLKVPTTEVTTEAQL